MMSFDLDNLFENGHKSFFGYKLKKKLNIRGRMTDKNERKNSFVKHQFCSRRKSIYRIEIILCYVKFQIINLSYLCLRNIIIIAIYNLNYHFSIKTKHQTTLFTLKNKFLSCKKSNFTRVKTFLSNYTK
jgi:hypothetical protein